MAQNYTSIAERNLAGGINKQASEDSIPEGYVENAVNVTVNPEGLIKKRPGFRTYLGHLPIRVANVTWDHTKLTDNLTFELTSSEHSNVDVDLSNVPSTALLVIGRTSTAVGTGPEFNSTYSYRYYTGFSANPRKTVLASTAGTLSYPQAEHGYSTKDLFVGLAHSDSQTNKSNTQLWASGVEIDEGTFDVSIGYDNDSNSSAFPVFTYALPLSGIVGSSYAAVHTALPVGGDLYEITIPASTHNLNSYNILTRCYEGNGTGTLTEIIPNEVIVNSATGEVRLQFLRTDSPALPSFPVRVLLHIPNVGNQYIDAVAEAGPTGSTVSSFEIPNLEGDFLFLDCFVKVGNIRTRVIPTDVQVDVLAQTATVIFDNTVAVSDEVVLIWDYAVVKTTKLSVTAQTTLGTSGTDGEPELSIYGIQANELYPEGVETQNFNAWVQHLDTYRSEGNTTLVAGMGWNLFRGVPRDVAASYLALPLLYPSLRSRAVDGTILAPAFHGDDQTVNRTRGAIRFLGGAEGWGQIESITWDQDAEAYAVTIPTPNLAIVGSPVQAFTDSQPFGDMLTINGAELRSFEGEWPIVAKNPGVAIYVTSSPNQYVTFYIKTSFTGSDYNCGKAGEAGIFTDQLRLDTSTPLLLTTGDQLSAQSFPAGTQLGFVGYQDLASTRYTFVNGVVDEVTLSTGQLVTATRQSRYCYGLRNLEGSITGFNQANNLVLVRGDSLVVSTLSVPLEVKQVLAESYSGLTLSVANGVGTLSGLSDARQFAPGQRVLISALGLYSGEFQVTEIASTNTAILLDCTGVPDIELTAVDIPPHFELREALTFSDDFFNRNTFAVEGRWECIEQPQIDTPNLSRYSLIEPTVTEHFNALDFGAQLPIRSTMSQDNLYLTNGIDPVQKYDGVATYRAGLPRWNPQLFMSQGSVPTSALDEGVYNYYFRISAIDVHENVILSATTGIEDYKIDVSNNHSVHIRLIGFPNWDDYDFEKLSVEIYRTKVNLPGEYFFLARLEMPQIPAGGYIDFTDVTEDSLLQAQGVDEYVSVTFGTVAAANTLSEPLRAKYITSIDNRIVLANLRDWQRAELNFSKLSGLLQFTDFVGKTLILRNDSNESLLPSPPTVTDMHNRVGFYFTNTHYALATPTYNSTTKVLTCVITTTQTAQPGDWIYLTVHGNIANKYFLSGTGWWQIKTAISDSLAGTLTVTINMPSYDSTNTHLNAAVLAPAGTKHVPVYLGTEEDVWEMSSGNKDDIITILRRLAAAVNCCMRQVDTSLSGYSTFKPWIMADAGGDFPAGQINFVRPREQSEFFAVTLPAFTAESGIKVEYLRQYVTGTVTAVQRRFPSRIIASYQGFPEMFNRAADLSINPQTDELVPIDVNAADGQEITGIISFFGESAYSGSQREEQLVVFKTNSIYIVDIGSRKVQKLQSNGLGCTAPYSIASTKDGIMFANESGIYKLTRSQTIEPVGQFVDRIWQEEVERNQLSLTHGHHSGVERQYKLSVPVQDATENSDVLVYEHTRESRGQIGAWTRYTNHPATGWCNLFDQEFFATSQGRVCVLKDSRTKLDFSDRGEPIEAEITFRSSDFGIPNTRKRLLHLSLHFRNPQEEGVNVSQESTEVSIAADLTEDFQDCNKYVGAGLFTKTNLSDAGLLKGETIRFSVPTTKAVRFQPKVSNSGLYETLQISGITYRVAGMTTKGTKEAEDSTR
jgi:hypothetical protein